MQHQPNKVQYINPFRQPYNTDKDDFSMFVLESEDDDYVSNTLSVSGFAIATTKLVASSVLKRLKDHAENGTMSYEMELAYNGMCAFGEWTFTRDVFFENSAEFVTIPTLPTMRVAKTVLLAAACDIVVYRADGDSSEDANLALMLGLLRSLGKRVIGIFTGNNKQPIDPVLLRVTDLVIPFGTSLSHKKVCAIISLLNAADHEDIQEQKPTETEEGKS